MGCPCPRERTRGGSESRHAGRRRGECAGGGGGRAVEVVEIGENGQERVAPDWSGEGGRTNSLTTSASDLPTQDENLEWPSNHTHAHNSHASLTQAMRLVASQ